MLQNLVGFFPPSYIVRKKNFEEIIFLALPGIKPKSSAVRVQSPNHWTSRELPVDNLLNLVLSLHLNFSYFDISNDSPKNNIAVV